MTDAGAKLPDPLPIGGTAIALKASFVGIKGVPVVALAHNSAFPSLVLYEDRLVQRVIFRRERKLSDIEYVHVALTGTDNLEIAYKHRRFTFSAKILFDGDLARALQFFERKGIKLTDRARLRLHDDRVIARE